MKAHGFSLVTTLAAVASLAAETVPPLPKDAQSLRKSYLDARERALQPIESRYRTELERLLASYTKAGKLDEALAIRAELAALENSGGQASQIIGTWKYEDGDKNRESEVDLLAGGAAIYRRSGERGKWSLNNRTLTITWSGGYVYTVKLPADVSSSTLKGTVSTGTEFRFTKQAVAPVAGE